jgi:CRP-like cAMP-binding protein
MSLYFLLSGKCFSETIVVKNGKGFIRRSNISPGEAFGEFGVSSEEKRGYTVHTIAQSVVFSVPREVYIQMMKEEVMINKSEKIEVLRSISAFQAVSSTILDAVLASSYVYRYEPNFPLLKTGERDNVYFILEGQCRANRLIPFLVTNQTKVEALTPEITGAYVPGVKPGPDESVLYYNMSIGILGPGSFFPRISLLRHEGLQYRLQKFDVAKIIVLVNSILKHKPKDGPLADKTNIAAIFNQELSDVRFNYFTKRKLMIWKI